MEDKKKLLGERLKMMRETRGFKQNKVAKYLGIHNSTLAKCESGEREPDIDTIYKLAKLYEVESDWLLGISKEKASYNIRNYDGIIKDISAKYPDVNFNDPDIRRKIMKVIDLVLDDYEKGEKKQ